MLIVEEIMLGKFTFSSAKEAKKLRKTKGEKKRNKPLPNMSHVDRLSGAQSTPSESAEPSPAKSSTKRVRLSEEGVMTLTLPSADSVYSEPAFMQLAVKSFTSPGRTQEIE